MSKSDRFQRANFLSLQDAAGPPSGRDRYGILPFFFSSSFSQQSSVTLLCSPFFRSPSASGFPLSHEISWNKRVSSLMIGRGSARSENSFPFFFPGEKVLRSAIPFFFFFSLRAIFSFLLSVFLTPPSSCFEIARDRHALLLSRCCSRYRTGFSLFFFLSSSFFLSDELK